MTQNSLAGGEDSRDIIRHTHIGVAVDGGRALELRLVCDEDGDYPTETLLSRTGVRKVANVALYEVSREPGRTRVYF